MIAVLLLGVGAGLALATFIGALAPAPIPLHRALAEAEPAPSSVRPAEVVFLGHRLARLLGAERLVGPGLASDLAVAGHDESWFAAWAVLLGLVGLVAGPVLEVVAVAAGVSLPALLWLGASIIGAVGCVGAHLISVRADASRRRAEFAFGLSAFLDLVVVSMAAGRGIEGALTVGAQSGSGWVFEALRQSLGTSRLRGVTPWAGLDELGQAWDIAELRGLAASIELAGVSGAKVRASVAARTRAMRLRGLSDARAAAETATERMSLPVVLLVIGFMILIGYPAVVEITARI